MNPLRMRVCMVMAELMAWGVTVGLAQPGPVITLNVDATQAPEKILHSRLQMPVKPGPLTLYYPK